MTKENELKWTDAHVTHNGEYVRNWTDNAIDKVDIKARREAFKVLIPAGVCSILEVGCGAGYNLKAIREFAIDMHLVGIDIEKYAVDKALLLLDESIVIVLNDARKMIFPENRFDLVMCVGSLSWISYEDLEKVVQECIRVSSKYIMVIDYSMVGNMSPHNKEVELIVSARGFPMYAIRNYDLIFQQCRPVGYIDKLPDSFSVVPISAWLFEKIQDKESK